MENSRLEPADSTNFHADTGKSFRLIYMTYPCDMSSCPLTYGGGAGKTSSLAYIV